MALNLTNYTDAAALTITLASLASTVADPPVGRQSTEVDNSVDKFLDVLLDGQITTGTTPTPGRIRVWAWGVSDDATNQRRPAGVGASDAGLTPVSHFASVFRPVVIMPTNTTSDQVYSFVGIGLAQLFGGFMPVRWGIFVDHNTVAILNATGGNHEIQATGIKTES